MGRLTLERATEDECDIALQILNEAQAWLISQGSPQWPVPFLHELVVESIARGETFIGRVDGHAVAALRLSWSDPLWFDRPQPSGYIHSLAIRRAFAGQGLSRQLLDIAAELAEAEGKAFLRLDCYALNTSLRGIYLGAGFTQVNDVIEWAHGAAWLVSRLERSLKRSQ